MKFMKSIKFVVGSAVLVSLAGCSVSPVQGAFNFAKWDGPVSNPSVSSIKSGESCAKSVLGLVAFGDASIEAAKKAAGISKVATVDHKTTNILYFYGEYCTVVYGE
jgi:hypothetical protein